MANLKEIRKRIGSVKSTQKITRAMKMISAARLSRAQSQIVALRPYAREVGSMFRSVVSSLRDAGEAHPLLEPREERKVLLVVLSGDRGLCGGFNGNVAKAAEREYLARVEEGQEVSFATIGKKGRAYFARRNLPVVEHFPTVWDHLSPEEARLVTRSVLRRFVSGEVDSIYLVYNEFKSAMTQEVVVQPLWPLPALPVEEGADTPPEILFEPSRGELLSQVVPMYLQLTVLRALYESMASELGARMTAMDAATKNASELIGKLTLEYNRARQAAITTELMEIIGGANALQG